LFSLGDVKAFHSRVIGFGTTLVVAALPLACESGTAQDYEEAGRLQQELEAPGAAAACVEQTLPLSAALASSTENAGTPASAAIDGNTGTRWSSAFSDPQWLRLDLGVKKKVTHVKINWETAGARDYQIQVSDDGNTFTSIASRTGLASSNHRIDDLTGLNGAGRYVRIFATARSTQFGDSIWEAQVFGDPDPNCTIGAAPSCTDGIKNGTETDIDCGGSCTTKCQNGKGCGVNGDCSSSICTGGVCQAAPTCSDGIKNGTETGVDCGGSCPPCATVCVSNALNRVSASATSLENATFPASNAIDGNSATRWSSAFSDPQSITVDLGATDHISRVVLSWETAASANYSLATADSAAGPFTTIYGPVVGDGGTDDIQVSGRGRFVRMTSTARTTQFGVSLFEFQIFGDTNPNCTTSSGTDSDNDRLTDTDEVTRGTDPHNPDTDGDGLPDGDEVLGTIDGLNLPAMGVNPRHKDILMEFDWFTDALDCGQHSHQPTAGAIARVTQAFATSPVTNPDGVNGIHLISDYGQGGVFTGGNFINDADGVVDSLGSEFYGYKAANFAANRNASFHYVIMPHQYGDRTNFSSGLALFAANDLIVSLSCSVSDVNVGNTIMHELGHNLNLHHGGDEDTNFKPNYSSVMNYRYQFPGVDTTCDGQGDGVLDYSHGTRGVLDESGLSEAAGICNNVPQDWNFNGVIDPGLISVDINTDDFLSALHDYNDWPHLFYDFAPTGSSGLGTNALGPRRIAICQNAPPRP